MATAKKTSTEVKLTPAQSKRKIEELTERIRILEEDSSHCYLCDKTKKKDKFYVSTDPMNKSGRTPICSECARRLALRIDKNGDEHAPTKDSVQLALKYLNKPYLESVWNSSVQESENLIAGKTKSNVWTSYIKNIAMVNYVGMTYFDSDFYKVPIIYDDEKTVENSESNADIIEAFEQNKNDARRIEDVEKIHRRT